MDNVNDSPHIYIEIQTDLCVCVCLYILVLAHSEDWNKFLQSEDILASPYKFKGC